MLDLPESLAGIDAGALHAVISAVPEPVVALDRHLQVVALNRPAQAIERGSRLGEPFPMVLRLPPLAAAIERALAQHGAQQVEFSEGGRIERWYRAHVMPVAPGGAPRPEAGPPTPIQPDTWPASIWSARVAVTVARTPWPLTAAW